MCASRRAVSRKIRPVRIDARQDESPRSSTPASAGGTTPGPTGGPPWRRGEIVTVRFRSIDGRFHSGRPVRVVEHTPELLVTYLAEGTIVSVPVLVDGRGLRDVPLDERWAQPRTSERALSHGT